MKKILLPSLEQLDESSKNILTQVQKKMGKVPNLYAAIGYSSSALKAMMDTEATLSHDSSFSAKEREAINLIVSEVNNCEYCLAAHTAIAKMKGFTEEETISIRKAAFSELKLNNVLRLAQEITQNHGKATEETLNQFFETGYTEKALVELTALVSLRSFTNYVYANTKIPVDFPQATTL